MTWGVEAEPLVKKYSWEQVQMGPFVMANARFLEARLLDLKEKPLLNIEILSF